MENITTTKQPTNWSALSIVISLFFFWGFVAASNSMLIPLFREKLQLSQTQAQLVDLAFYIAYFVGSMIYLLVGRSMGQDPLNKIGYKRGVIIGLLISAFGMALFYPATQIESYAFMLSALFTVGLGFSLLQTAAQPFAIALGDPSSGAQRLNLAGGINNFGTTIGPVIFSYAIFGALSESAPTDDVSIQSLQAPYLTLGALFLLLALLFKVSKLPVIVSDEKIEQGYGVLKYPQLTLGMLAIFLYVGVEVAMASNLGEYLKVHENLSSSEISHYVSLFWASLMVGRWSAAVAAFNPSKTWALILKVLVPYIAFGVYILVNTMRGSDVSDLYDYAVCIAIMIVVNFLSQDRPARQLMLFALLGIAFISVGLLADGKMTLYCFLAGGLCCSVLWPCIFTLAISGLGKYTSQGSAFLVAMIMGGALVPVLQGFIADKIGIKESYFIAILCFGYLAWYGFKVARILRSQGIDFESTANVKGGH
jgi:FHS family L-fucose permease-like MFS transporter